MVPHNIDHVQVRLWFGVFFSDLASFLGIVPHNTDHVQVRLGLVFSLVT